MAAPIDFIGESEMAAEMKDRLAKMDQAIELMQGLRKETAELFAELFPEAV